MTKKNESTALAVITPEEQAYLDSLKPKQSQGPSGPNRLTINTKSRDEDGNKLVIGSWHITGTDKYYDGVIKFRPVRKANKLISYVEGANGAWNLRGESVYFEDFRNEIPDSTGGNALGRKFGKKYSDEEKEASKKAATVYMDVFGIVTFGDEEFPVLFRTQAGKMYRMGTAFDAIPKGKEFSQYSFNIEALQETDPKTKKVNEFWSIQVTPDLSKTLPISPILAFDKEVQEYISAVNESVLNQYRQNSRGYAEDNFVASVHKPVQVSAHIIEDDLPF